MATLQTLDVDLGLLALRLGVASLSVVLPGDMDVLVRLATESLLEDWAALTSALSAGVCNHLSH